MTNVGILSLYFNNSNYGGLLQAYALLHVIGKMGYQCKQISYDWNSEDIRSSNLVRTLVHPIRAFVFGKWYKDYCNGVKLLKKFELSIPHTKIVNSKTISSLNRDFDFFICGSDQVWNPLFWQDSFFLSFVEPGKKKIAYAASMARNGLSASEANYALKMMQGFSKISLREIESVKALQEYNKSFFAEVMPDPTLLLTSDEWEQITTEPVVSEPYIFAYFLGDNSSARNASIRYAKNEGKKIVFISSLLIESRKWEMANHNAILSNIGVNDFLSLIKYADLVITDSFHGSVFSSIFGVPFITFNRSKDNNLESMNSRITTLMSMLGIKRNIKTIECGKDYSFTTDETKTIKKALKDQREKGIEFLKEALSTI